MSPPEDRRRLLSRLREPVKIDVPAWLPLLLLITLFIQAAVLISLLLRG